MTIYPFTLASSGLAKQASTGVGGYTLVNGTGPILSWTAPNDGAIHRVQIFGIETVTSALTGGDIAASFTDPGGTNNLQGIFAAGNAAGQYAPIADNWYYQETLIEPGSTFLVEQFTAAVAGAAKLWLEIWGL